MRVSDRLRVRVKGEVQHSAQGKGLRLGLGFTLPAAKTKNWLPEEERRLGARRRPGSERHCRKQEIDE